MKYIGLVRDDGKVEYNARFVLGNGAEELEAGRIYTVSELENFAGKTEVLMNGKIHGTRKPFFIQTCAQNPVSEDYKRRWRCEVL